MEGQKDREQFVLVMKGNDPTASKEKRPTGSDIGWCRVNIVNQPRWNTARESHRTEINDSGHAAEDLCEKALNDARAQLHPLLRSAELRLLGERHEFVKAFRLALEQRIARKLATWQTRVLSVFRFDQTRRPPDFPWDGSIHLLAKVPRVSKTIQTWGQTLDKSLLPCLRALGWSCFQERHSLLEIQQVTPEEIRRGIGYGGMFFAAYTRPVRIWPKDGSHERKIRE